MTEMDNVSKKVLDDAGVQAGRIVDEAKEKASNIISEAEKKKAERISEGRSQAENKYREVFDRELSRVRSELNQKLLLRKLSIVEGVIEKAREKLCNLDTGQYKKFLKKAFSAQGIKKGTYIIGKNESSLDSRMVGSISELKEDSSVPDFDRGVKVIDGKAEFLFSPDSYIDMDMEDLKMEIAYFLFGREK